MVRRPEDNEEHCERCGKQTITERPKCKMPIRGHLYYEHINCAERISAHNFCIACGKPFPWFETKVEAVKELAGMHEDLDDKDRELLKANFDDLIQDNPKSEVAALKIKPVLKKLKQGAKDPLYKFAVDVASEIGKKILLGGMET